MTILWMVVGLVLLMIGGDAVVRGAVAVARRLGLSPLLIGLTLVGFGTSTPELVTSVKAAWADAPGIAVGNVVGSNIANILLILGVAAVITPLRTAPAAFARDGAAVMGVAVIGVGIVLVGWLDRLPGLAMLALLASYIFYTYRQEKREAAPAAHKHEGLAEIVQPAPEGWLFSVVLLAVGLGATILGASLLVDNTLILARAAGISETILGLTLVAVGTSLPELVTSVMAALRKEGEVAFGNVIGSNIYNVLGILGATAVLHPIEVPAQIGAFDVWVMLGATVLLVLAAGTRLTVSRREGIVFLGFYAAYIAVLGAFIL